MALDFHSFTYWKPIKISEDLHEKKWIIKSFWSSPSEVFLEKGHTLAWVFSCKFAAYFQNTFSWEHLWRAASGYFEQRTFSQKQ